MEARNPGQFVDNRSRDRDRAGARCSSAGAPEYRGFGPNPCRLSPGFEFSPNRSDQPVQPPRPGASRVCERASRFSSGERSELAVSAHRIMAGEARSRQSVAIAAGHHRPVWETGIRRKISSDIRGRMTGADRPDRLSGSGLRAFGAPATMTSAGSAADSAWRGRVLSARSQHFDAAADRR